MTRDSVTIVLQHPKLYKAANVDAVTPFLLRKNMKLILANARAIDSDAGGGNHGHMGLLMTPPDYAAIPGTVPWVDPINPARPVFAAGTSAVQMNNDIENYKEEKNDYTVMTTFENMTIQQLMEAHPTDALSALEDPLTGFAGV